jgi:hypothetical protein
LLLDPLVRALPAQEGLRVKHIYPTPIRIQSIEGRGEAIHALMNAVRVVKELEQLVLKNLSSVVRIQWVVRMPY